MMLTMTLYDTAGFFSLNLLLIEEGGEPTQECRNHQVA